MKLAEALLLRADLQKKLASVKQRIEHNIQIPQDEQPDEDPQELLTQAQQINDDLLDLIRRIHRSNAISIIENNVTMLDAIIQRDKLIERHKIIMSALTPARLINQNYGNRDIKWVAAIPVKHLQYQADEIAEKIRLVNNKIQASNWLIDLSE